MPIANGSESADPSRPAPIPNSLHNAKPFRRQSVRGVGADVLLEHATPNNLGPHVHAQWQITIVPPGAAVEIGWRSPSGKTEKRRILGGDVWLLPPGWTHSARWMERATFIVLYLDELWVRKYFPLLPQGSTITGLTEYVAANPLIADLCRELRQLADTANGPTDWKVASAGSHLATLLLQAHLMLEGGVFRPPSALVGKILNNLRSHIAERSNERVPIAQMAGQFGISDRHLRRIFRQATGVSPQEWVMAEKVKKAAQLLLEGDSVKETVEQAGFTSESHLHRAMFRVYGISPTAFRKQAQASAVPSRA